MVFYPVVNVIIVGYNGEDLIGECIESLLVQNYPKDKYFITVIDNNSHDRTVDVVRSFPSVELMRNARNIGFGSANNIVLRNSVADYAVLLNQDSVVESGFISELVSVMEKDAAIGACGAAEHPYDATLKSSRKTEETDWIGCGAVIVRMSAVRDIGFFDKNYFMYGEDIDLSLRLLFGGWKIYYHPRAVWHHYGRHRKVEWNDFRLFHSVVSRAYLLVKFASISFLFNTVKKRFTCVKESPVSQADGSRQAGFGTKNRLLFFFSVFFHFVRKLPFALKNRFAVRRLKVFDQSCADEILKRTG